MSDEYTAAAQQDEESGNIFNYLPAILWQRRWFLIIPTIVLSIAGVAAAFLLPTTYRSSATLLVESQELPEDLVLSSATNLIDQRIAKIRQQVLSRGDLIELIQQNNLYPSERQKEPLSKIIEEMREDTRIEALSADIGQRNGAANTIAFSMSFDYSEPAQTQLVMQSFVERFLELDATQQSEQATSTVDFLSEQANQLQQQIAMIEGRITAIKTSNGAVLASSGIQTSSNPGSYDAQILALQRENNLLAQQARNQSAANDEGVTQAEAAVTTAKALYKEGHPDIKIAEQRLVAAKEVAAAKSPQNNAELSAIAINANNAQIAALGRARAAEGQRTQAAFSAQMRAPLVMEQIAQLENRAATLRGNYQGISQRLLAARSSAKMESEQKGERLSVVDPPIVPEEPLSPNRPLLIAGGIAGGLLTGLVLTVLFELLLRPIRGVGPIERMLGVPPLVVIPTLRAAPTRGSRFLSRIKRWTTPRATRREPKPAE